MVLDGVLQNETPMATSMTNVVTGVSTSPSEATVPLGLPPSRSVLMVIVSGF